MPRSTAGWPTDRLARQLRRIAPQGVTEGSLFVPPEYMEIPLMV